MAKEKPPKTQIRKQPATGVRQSKTRVRAQPPTKVIQRTVIVREKPEAAKRVGSTPWIGIGGAIAVLLLLFLPIFPAQKIVDKTETVMVPVTKERQETVTVDEDIKTYTGYLEEQGASVTKTGYSPETRTVIRYDAWNNPYYYTYTENVPYTYNETVPGKQTTIDAVAEIVEIGQARGPNDTWTITLTAHDGTQVVYRDVVKYDLTKTGRATVKVTKTVNTPYTTQEPQEVTKQETLKLSVSLLSLILKNY
jgi:hypothetical protein